MVSRQRGFILTQDRVASEESSFKEFQSLTQRLTRFHLSEAFMKVVQKARRLGCPCTTTPILEIHCSPCLGKLTVRAGWGRILTAPPAPFQSSLAPSLSGQAVLS